MKLWKKDYDVDKEIEAFTVGNDYKLDKKLVKSDCVASIAHAKMLHKLEILTKEEFNTLIQGLEKIKEEGIVITQEDEDCHTAIENALGEEGKKLHSLRSRNDQVLTALRLYEKDELNEIGFLMFDLSEALLKLIDTYGEIEMPGYTHMQKAMPTTIKAWLSSFIASDVDNVLLLNTTKKLIDQNPLGSAAGFGVPVFAIDKEMTTKELGFSNSQNTMYSQFSRGKFESTILHLLTQIMFDLNKLSTDLMLFSMQEFNYITIPKKFCTGSSIMPQKHNPDVLELVRAKYSVVLAKEFEIKSIIQNLMSGYNRDLQLTKEPLIKAIEETKSCLKIMTLVLDGIVINKDSCEKAMTKELYATEEAYKLVKEGMPFRDAYKLVSSKNP